ncbi:MAG: rifampicin phosphotransferase [Patescibacteria group bacterium]|nr:rifampicin phosphotransferase [Patescibacteria group bacterium]
MKNVLELQDTLSVGEFGGKAANLSTMMRAGLPVPDGFAVGLKAFIDGKLDQLALQDIQILLNDKKLYAVRSSALAEDAEGASWAGQFETFLNTKPENVIAKIEECHNSAKERALAYASNQELGNNFEVAVVVQEMVQPKYAGVLFTKDPVSGKDQLVTEYVEGLGEDLVSGKSDPKRVVINVDQSLELDFDYTQLIDLAEKTEKLFGMPQDIEWAWSNNMMWFVQARPITATGKLSEGYNLGEPEDLFYWGPSRADPLYMSEFMAGVERLFKEMVDNPDLPTPPKNLVLFDEGKMVWLSNSKEFFSWCEATFESYEKQNRVEQDLASWQTAVDMLREVTVEDYAETAINVWYLTEYAEFSLYGAEAALTKRLSRFEDAARQEIWTAFTVPDKPTFLSRIDRELAESQDPNLIAEKYPWIQDGYHGVSDNAEDYFVKRLEIVGNEFEKTKDHEPKRKELIIKYGLNESEVSALTLSRKLAEFMDERKAWMMRTRRLLKKSVCKIEHGWFFNGKKVILIDKDNTHELWQRYVDFKVSTNAVAGVVACNGGKHFIHGEVVVVTSPTDSVQVGKIVVVPSTSPSYVPLMRKAKALITDHGGMMSHAAIVAREFNLPCIVGTKQGTKILSNSSAVVLDLVTGDVKRMT